MAAPTATEKFINWITGLPIALFDATGSIFNPSGASSSIGLVPDPGATPGTSKFLREDATWNNAPAPAAGSITNAQLADMAQSTIKGRENGAGSGSPEDLTATQATAILSAFVGDSGLGGTKGLVPAPAAGDAAANKFLNADGTFKTNAITHGATLIASGNLTGATVDITNIPATYTYLFLLISGFSSDTATRQITVLPSVNNGSTFDTTGANYVGYNVTNASAVAASAFASLVYGLDQAAANTANISLSIFNYNGSMNVYSAGRSSISTGSYTISTVHWFGSTSAINALRLALDGTGNFDAGTYVLYGVT